MRAIAIVVLAGCSISDVDFTGKSCPCPTGYDCDLSTQTCTKHLTPPDAPGDTPADTPVAQSCLTNPFTELFYASPTFADFSTAWSVGGGNWSVMGGEAVQVNELATLSFIHHPLGVAQTNYRVVSKMRATSGGVGNAIETALRVDALGTNMYHCNWEPVGGAFLIQRTDSINDTSVINETTVNTASIPNYSPTATFTMEFQVNGTGFECCMRGIDDASISGDDSVYDIGNVGLKTFRMAGAFSGFEVYLPER